MYTPGTMNIMATYLGAVFVVQAASINANTAKHRGNTMWKKRSPVRSVKVSTAQKKGSGTLPACQELRKVVMTART